MKIHIFDFIFTVAFISNLFLPTFHVFSKKNLYARRNRFYEDHRTNFPTSNFFDFNLLIL